MVSRSTLSTPNSRKTPRTRSPGRSAIPASTWSSRARFPRRSPTRSEWGRNASLQSRLAKNFRCGRFILEAGACSTQSRTRSSLMNRHLPPPVMFFRAMETCRRQRSCLSWRRLCGRSRRRALKAAQWPSGRGSPPSACCSAQPPDGESVMAGSGALVIGGGPAGGMLATHLARAGRRVILAERSSGPHDKVCGEFLSEEAARSLSELDIDLAALGAAEISGVRLHERNKSVAVELPFRAYCMSRRILDEAVLAAALSSGAEVRRGVHIKSLERKGSM